MSVWCRIIRRSRPWRMFYAWSRLDRIEFITEKYAVEIESLLKEWGHGLEVSARDTAALARLVDASIAAPTLAPAAETRLRSNGGLEIVRRKFGPVAPSSRERFLQAVATWLGPVSRVETAEFEITAIEEFGSAPLRVRADIRYDIVTVRNGQREERVGSWRTEWSRSETGWSASRWETGRKHSPSCRGRGFSM